MKTKVEKLLKWLFKKMKEEYSKYEKSEDETESEMAISAYLAYQETLEYTKKLLKELLNEN